MNKIQGFFQNILGIKQAVPAGRKPIVPFTPRASFGLSEPASMDLQSQMASYRSWVYACVKKRAKEVANVKLILVKRISGSENKIVEMHEVLDLLGRVNDFMTRYDLLELWETQMALTGESYWWKIKGTNGKIISIYPYFNPAYMQILPDAEKFISKFVYTVPGTGIEISFTADEMIFFKEINPENPYRGISSVKAAEYAIASDREASNWNWRFFKNSARPDVALEVPGTLTQEQYERMQIQWENSYKGTQNAHKLAILEGGAKFADKMTLSQKDMDFLAQRNFSRDEIFTIFGVPKGIMVADDVNRAVSQTHFDFFYKNTIVPQMQKLVSYLNEFLLKDYDDDSLFFDFENPMSKDILTDIQYYQSGIVNGWLTPNEVRKIEGLAEVEGGNRLFLPLNLTAYAENLTYKGYKPNLKTYKRTTSEMVNEIVEEQIEKLGKIMKKSSVKKGNKDSKKKEKGNIVFPKELKRRMSDYFVEKAIKNERLLRKKLQGQFKDQKQMVLDTLEINNQKEIKAGLGFSFRFDINKEMVKTLGYSNPQLEEILKHDGQEILGILGLDLTFDTLNERIDKFFAGRGLKFARAMHETTYNKLVEVIKDGVRDGRGITDITKEVQDVFREGSDVRAYAIARSETARVSNFAITEGYKQSGVVKAKEWVTARDEMVCNYCEPMDGKELGLDKNFFDEGNQFYGNADTPLDLSYEDVESPPLHVNCRCSTIPVLIGKGFNTEWLEKKLAAIMVENQKNREMDEMRKMHEDEINEMMEMVEAIKKELPVKIQDEVKKVSEMEIGEIKKLRDEISKELYGG